MPFVPSTMSAMMASKAASQGLAGSKLPTEFAAISAAVSAYFSLAAGVVSSKIVTGPGVGTFNGKVVGLVPSAMSSLMVSKAASQGLVGRDTKKLFDAVSFGVCQTLLSTVTAQGVVIGGGPGTGNGKIINLVPIILQGIILALFASKSILGSKTLALTSAIAFGVCTHIMSAGTIVTTCVGAFLPPPVGPIPITGAPGIGKLF